MCMSASLLGNFRVRQRKYILIEFLFSKNTN